MYLPSINMPNLNLFSSYGTFMPAINYNNPLYNFNSLYALYCPTNIWKPMPFQNFNMFNTSNPINMSNTISFPSFSMFNTGNNIFANLQNLCSKKQINVTNSNEVLQCIKDVGYNKAKGLKLAKIAANNAVGFRHKCATYVKKAIEECGLGKYEYGHAYACANILKRNKNFKEISTKGLDLSKLPAGCVLVYGRNGTIYSKKYGHVEITLGNGQAASDGITNNIQQGARVFVPVSRNYTA